jgi:uncharacterized protein YbaA (DUF1428 family)
MAYADGFLIPVPKKNLKAYAAMSRKAGKVWREHGALDYKECVGDDLEHKGMWPFGRAARTKTGETVVFSWILYKSRAHRDAVNKKVMKDKRLEAMMTGKAKMPFDPKKMAYGGFRVIVNNP